MVKNLSPIIYGKPLSDDELAFEKEMTYGLMLKLEAKVIMNSNDMKNCGDKAGGCMKCCFCFCCYFKCCKAKMHKGFLERNTMESDDFDKEMQMIDAKLSKNKFLSGDEIGILDLSLYGASYPMGKEPKMECFK